MRQAKAAKKSPEPKLPTLILETTKGPSIADIRRLARQLAAPIPPEEKAKFPPTYQEPADVLDHLVEEYAWQLVEKIKVRAAQLLGLEVAP